MSARISRRHFFFGSLLAGAVPAGGFGSTPSLTAAGFKSFNEKLNIGGIGCGIRSGQILPQAAVSENIVALCDVDEVRSAATFGLYPQATKYKDYRVMLEKEGKNLDAVMIAVPDHLHTHISLAAMQHGKHVYCEKPLTRTFTESQLLAEAALKYKVATQMGNQGFNHEALKTACEILWSGDIGEVREVWGWTGGIYGGQPQLPETGPEKQDIPATLDWDLWLGPAAPRDFNAQMTGRWRAFQDFSTGGSLGDWLVHILGPAHMALQLDKVPPTSVERIAVEGESKWLWPLKDHIVFEFPARGNMPPVTVHACQNTLGGFKTPDGMLGPNGTDRLFPGMDNLVLEKNRPFQETGDGLFQVAGLGPDGKAQAGGRAWGRRRWAWTGRARGGRTRRSRSSGSCAWCARSRRRQLRGPWHWNRWRAERRRPRNGRPGGTWRGECRRSRTWQRVGVYRLQGLYVYGFPRRRRLASA